MGGRRERQWKAKETTWEGVRDANIRRDPKESLRFHSDCTGTPLGSTVLHPLWFAPAILVYTSYFGLHQLFSQVLRCTKGNKGAPGGYWWGEHVYICICIQPFCGSICLDVCVRVCLYYLKTFLLSSEITPPFLSPAARRRAGTTCPSRCPAGSGACVCVYLFKTFMKIIMYCRNIEDNNVLS